MAHYWKRCPHCGRTIEQGYGYPTTSLGDPRRRCRFCFREYKDRSIIDWENASILKKILFYFANGRFFLCFIPYVLASCFVGQNVEWADWLVYLACSPVFLIIFALCALYVRHQVKEYLDIYGTQSKKDDKNRYDKLKNTRQR